MSERGTLILDRTNGDLWVDVDGRHKMCIWDVTGLEKDGDFSHIKILRKGKTIGSAWYAAEIKERW